MSPDSFSFSLSEPLGTFTVSSLPIPASLLTGFGLVLFAIVILVSLAIVYHLYTYARSGTIAFIASAVYAVGLFAIGSFIISSGFFF